MVVVFFSGKLRVSSRLKVHGVTRLQHFDIGRVTFTRAASHRRSRATSPQVRRLGEVGEITHSGQLGQSHSGNAESEQRAEMKGSRLRGWKYEVHHPRTSEPGSTR